LYLPTNFLWNLGAFALLNFERNLEKRSRHVLPHIDRFDSIQQPLNRPQKKKKKKKKKKKQSRAKNKKSFTPYFCRIGLAFYTRYRYIAAFIHPSIHTSI